MSLVSVGVPFSLLFLFFCATKLEQKEEKEIWYRIYDTDVIENTSAGRSEVATDFIDHGNGLKFLAKLNKKRGGGRYMNKSDTDVQRMVVLCGNACDFVCDNLIGREREREGESVRERKNLDE